MIVAPQTRSGILPGSLAVAYLERPEIPALPPSLIVAVLVPGVDVWTSDRAVLEVWATDDAQGRMTGGQRILI